MAAKNKFMNAMKMPAIADMFSSEADRQRESGDLVTEVPLSELHPFVWLAVPAGWLANFLISYGALRRSWQTDKMASTR